MEVSIYRNIKETKGNNLITINQTLNRIRTGKSKAKVEAIRLEKNKDKRNKLKQQLPCIIYGGQFSSRSKKGLIQSSGFAVLDFDDIDINYKETLKQDNYIYACWISPSGNGIKALVKIPEVANDDEYKEYYNALLGHYKDANIDKSTKDISRVAYESYDPKIFINTSSYLFKTKIVEKKEIIQPNIEREPTDDDTFNKLLTWINKTDSYIKGNRNNYLNKLAYACNSYGINKNKLNSIFKSNYDLPDKEIDLLINSAYSNTSIFNTASFDSMNTINKVKELIKVNTPIDEIRSKYNYNDKTIEKAKASINRVVATFWDVEGKKLNIVFHLEKFINWLEGNGYFKHILNGGEFILIKIDNNIVSQTYRHEIRRFAYDYINSLPYDFDGIKRTKLQEWFFAQEKKIISENVFELLTTKQIDFFTDNKDKATIFYNNCITEITTTGINTKNYNDFDNYIWKEQIINRDFEYKDYKNYGNFEKFISNILGNNKENVIALYTCIGYLIHSYKPTSFAPAIVLNDKLISDDPNGGTGKGLIAKAVSQFKNTVTLDGKTFDFNKSFAFQRVELSTDMIVLDDIKPNFSFETLFSIITEGITVEKKNKGEFFIPYEKSPKILITTNYALKGEGNSIERRKIDFELEQYYTKENTPYQEFGKMFFSEWDKNDWLMFDNFIMLCIQIYLKRGILAPINTNLQMKRLIANTNSDFIEYINDFNQFEERINKQEFHSDFVKATNLKNLKANTLTKWVKKWCEFNNYEYTDIAYNGIRYFNINKN